MMKKFKIVPLSKAYADKIRTIRIDDFGYEVTGEIATGKGPCRVSLKPFNIGVDSRMVFSHSPFAINNPYNQAGPVFINGADVDEYKDIYRFPPELKADKANFPLSLIGYNNEQQMVFTELVGDSDVENLITKIFEQRPDVIYLHARNSEACCYICKIERVEALS